VAFGGIALISGVAFGGIALISGVAFGLLIKGGLLHSLILY
jgi:hypothetical protein